MTAPRAAYCLCRLAIAALVAAVALPVSAAEEAKPLLRIETVRHISRMNDAAVDRAGHLLLTVGADTTARMWSLPDLRPLGVLRPPIGPRAEGALYAVAMSPDGAIAAVGGFRAEVLLFDLRSRNIVHRWPDLPDSVLSLAFSPDGTRLAIGLGAQGVRVLHIPDGALLTEDRDFSGGVYGLDFASDGRLAASSLDGGIRLYDAQGALRARVATSAGRRPTHLRFNPDGTLLAVGFNDAMAVEVRSGSTLDLRGRPSTAGLTGHSFEAVAWSADGQTLYAGGATLVKGAGPVFAWSGAGSGARRIAERGFASQVAAILPLPGGNLLLGSIDSDLAVARDDRRVAEVSPLRADFEVGEAVIHPSRRFRLSADGAGVEWVPLAAAPRYPAFDAAQLVFDDEPQPRPFLADWAAEADRLHVTDWDGGRQPRLNGAELPLEKNERAESVAVRNGNVLLGTQWLLRLYDGNGKPVWATPLPAPAWHVNQSPDGRLAVAALGDGTIRWFRLKDGKPLLTIFFTRADGRWIAFTPSGYYAAAAGAEDLIGWHLNRGADQVADFFPASRFRDKFYRPDVVRLVLAKLDEEEAVRTADAARGIIEAETAPITQDLPPVLNILSPTDGTQLSLPYAEVEYAVRSPSGRKLRGLRVLVDGSALTPAREGDQPAIPELASRDAEARSKVVVPIPAGKNVTVALLADTDTRTSAAAKVSLRGPLITVAPSNLLAPRLNAVLIGVSAYSDESLRHGVEFATDDATALRDLLERQRERGLYREVSTKLLVDSATTREGVLDALDWLQRRTTSNDISVVFMAGHGVDDNGRTFFLPVGADRDRLTATGLGQADLLDALKQGSGRKIAFLDFCHSGGAVLPQNRRGVDDVDIVGLLNQLREPGSGLIVFAAAKAREKAIQLDEQHHGAFTVALLDALGGGADLLHRGAVSTAELNVYIADRVRDLTGGKQHPIMQRADDLPDFPLVVTK